MAGFIEGVDRCKSVLFPDRLDDWIGEDSLVRVVDLFVEELDLTDPDVRAMVTSARHSGLVGYNMQSAVDAETHLFVAHDRP